VHAQHASVGMLASARPGLLPELIRDFGIISTPIIIIGPHHHHISSSHVIGISVIRTIIRSHFAVRGRCIAPLGGDWLHPPKCVNAHG
jgi:hypothetical protein